MKSVEIAGGGIGGLAMGAMLARDGWKVRIHERDDAVREVGAGIYIKNNSIEVLEDLGIFERMIPLGTKLEKAQIQFADGSVRQERQLEGLSRVHVFPRQVVVEALLEAAKGFGAEVVLNSQVAGATPQGVLKMANGEQCQADLIVGADGVNSAIRSSLDMKSGFKLLPTIIDRFLIDSREFTREPKTVEHWSGNRRIGVTPSGDGQTYVYMVAPESDRAARVMPLDVEDWSRRFPLLAGLMRELGAVPDATQFNYGIVHCEHWSRGRVAIIGDAAHGLPPTLGQGAGLTLINAYALAHHLRKEPDVERALSEWERNVRFISDATQAWSRRYDSFTRQWPTKLDFMRPLITWSFGHVKSLNDRMRIADRGLRTAGIEIGGGGGHAG
ncbi:FAD-dependent oxidoreductase [Paracandidimonas soli]|uniref:2-polyprenyl-6-methoxyphenol hydroxylase-like FAD-dependent oxidoreductase n=1 Tax=Paracandidimonas soli TaxID=1917182 RepID=A0A4V2VQV1_9BURK|nr:NAD(P)/FAD-dependent oxidoreductase [Paracandidimonas soli]TCU96049.1 2-polyprenyl-6-methoxyphenol hydroxylase-like FAD-dependent oxidoreductase [Paracandidimonas soli]